MDHDTVEAIKCTTISSLIIAIVFVGVIGCLMICQFVHIYFKLWLLSYTGLTVEQMLNLLNI